jgi:hypothetical protein
MSILWILAVSLGYGGGKIICGAKFPQIGPRTLKQIVLQNGNHLFVLV